VALLSYNETHLSNANTMQKTPRRVLARVQSKNIPTDIRRFWMKHFERDINSKKYKFKILI